MDENDSHETTTLLNSRQNAELAIEAVQCQENKLKEAERAFTDAKAAIKGTQGEEKKRKQRKAKIAKRAVKEAKKAVNVAKKVEAKATSKAIQEAWGPCEGYNKSTWRKVLEDIENGEQHSRVPDLAGIGTLAALGKRSEFSKLQCLAVLIYSKQSNPRKQTEARQTRLYSNTVNAVEEITQGDNSMEMEDVYIEEITGILKLDSELNPCYEGELTAEAIEELRSLTTRMSEVPEKVQNTDVQQQADLELQVVTKFQAVYRVALEVLEKIQNNKEDPGSGVEAAQCTRPRP